MKKFIVISLLFLFCTVNTNAQQNDNVIDSIVLSFNQPYTDAADLARQLTKPYQTTRDKARAIFAWVANNIRYDYQKYKNPPPNPEFFIKTKQELAQKQAEWFEKEIRHTLISKKGVCEDYSRLFKKMCDSAGIECAFIIGNSRAMNGRLEKHAWNAIQFNGVWHLIDATWGSGFADDVEERFVRLYAPVFFDTDPNLFILQHLPDEDSWQLLKQPLTKKEFKKQPNVSFSNPDFPVEAFFPENGKIVPIDDNAEIRLKLGKIPKVFIVASGKKQIPAEVHTADDGWVTLTFPPGHASEISVYVGKNMHKLWRILEFQMD